jgi:cardiolipin synthase A/B
VSGYSCTETDSFIPNTSWWTIFSSVGSPNVDVRSFDLDFEVTALIYDKDFALRLGVLFAEDLKNCAEITREEWIKRPRRERYKESLARIFGPLY